MKRILSLSSVLLVASTTLHGADLPQYQTRSLTVAPAAPPSPALKYALRVELSEQIPQNAVMYYHRAIALHLKLPEKFGTEWLEKPLADLPQKKVGEFLEGYESVLHELELAARCERCDWDLAESLRREPFTLRLPDIQETRNFAMLLRLRMRCEISQGRFAAAITSLRTGLTLAEHVNRMPTLISALVAVSIANQMLADVDSLLAMPGASNLYWSFTDLSTPFVNLRRGMEGERLMTQALMPHLTLGNENAHPPALSEDQLQQMVEHLWWVFALHEHGKSMEDFKLDLIGMTAKGYPAARRALASQGWSDAELDQLPALQTVVLYSLQEYNRAFDAMFKWHDLPYWQAQPQREKLHKKAAKFSTGDRLNGIPLAGLLVPSAPIAYASSMRVDRQLAFFRCLEAVRLHAFEHDGKLPVRLEDIKDVPVPVDPMTGKNFDYSVDDNSFILFAPLSEGEPSTPAAPQGHYLRYKVTIKR